MATVKSRIEARGQQIETLKDEIERKHGKTAEQLYQER